MSIRPKKRSVRVGQGAQILDISKATFWRWHKTCPDFPRAIKLSPGCTVWDEDELIAWRDAQRTKVAHATEGGNG